MSEITTTPSVTAADFPVRPVGSTPIRLSTGEWLPNRSVKRVWSPASQEGQQDGDYYVPATDWQRLSSHLKNAERAREKAVSYLRERFDSSGGEKPWFEEITLQFDEANEIISILQGELMEQARKYNFTVKVSYEVTGQVTAQGEEQAQAAVERLIDNMDDPGYYEPHIDGIDWEYIDVAHYETDDVDIEED